MEWNITYATQSIMIKSINFRIDLIVKNRSNETQFVLALGIYWENNRWSRKDMQRVYRAGFQFYLQKVYGK